MASISGDKFDSVLVDGDFTGNALLIVDEVHNAGAPTYRKTLRPTFAWRLGLSATPVRHFDEEGTEAIQDYFGVTVFTYDMRRTLEDGHLCPYRYYVYAAHLEQAEYDEYARLTRKISQLRGAGAADVTHRTENALDGDSEHVEQLLFRRARLLKKCHSKIDALDQALDDHPLERGLVYCADNDQLAAAVRVLRKRQIVHLTYTADTPSDERRSALHALGAGHVPVIAAIDCLDEGVDVPNVDEAIILASSSNKRQFIQRRGRILRIAPGKTIASLVDVIALPPLSAGSDARQMLNGELARVKEMAELAQNKYDALRAVKSVAAGYGVLLTELLSAVLQES
jgi:superfamily II DNA or RNA helicase